MGDTDIGMERDLLMPSQLPLLMLMLGMDIITVTGPMDTTDLMDTDTGMERDLPILNQLLMLKLALMLMLGTDTMATIHMLIMDTTDHTDTGVTGERSKHNSTNNETVLHKIIFLDSP